MITYIFSDFLEPVGYLPWGVLAGSLFLAGWGIWQRCRPREQRSRLGKKQWLTFFCVLYITVLLKLAFFSREPGSRNGMDLTLLSTWGISAQAHAYFIENILMFIPFGILMPARIPPLRRASVCVGTACLCSVMLETAQLLTGRGYCQLDDVVTNTLGAGIGYLLYKSYKYLKTISP